MGSSDSIRFEFIRAQRDYLVREATSASDGKGMIDTAKVEDPTVRATLQSLGGGVRFTHFDFIHRIDAAYQGIDKADVGLLGSRIHTDAGCAGEHYSLLKFLGLTRNFRTDESERATIERNPLAAQLLAFVDTRVDECDKVLELARHFGTGRQQLISREDGTMSIKGDALATNGLRTIVVKNLESGKRFAAAIEADGSYELPLGSPELHQTFRIWYEPAEGPTFVGGDVSFSASARRGDVADVMYWAHSGAAFPPPILTLLGLREKGSNDVPWDRKG
ncbi:MAG: hypothetical protein AAB426_13970 [Myxococcota bacterium]|mgnify:CR=1 FL=1